MSRQHGYVCKVAPPHEERKREEKKKKSEIEVWVIDIVLRKRGE